MSLFDEVVGRVQIDRVVDTLSQMVQIPSVNPFAGQLNDGSGERRLAEHLAGELDRLGWNTGLQDVAPGRVNTWAIIGEGNGPTLALAGHLDTVGVKGYDDPFSARVSADRVYGRGSCDMKGALAAYLEAARVLHEADVRLKGRLMIIGLADEEYQLKGSEAFHEVGITPDMAIIGEPTSLSVCTAHLGQLALYIRTFGRAVHSSVPERGVNAIDKMSNVLRQLRAYRTEIAERTPHPLCGAGRISPGVIRGGSLVSAVPDWCEIELDRRILPNETSDTVRNDLQRHLERLAETDPDLRYEIGETTFWIPPLDTDPDSTIAKAASAAARAHGLPDTPAGFAAATDGPNLSVPTVICGPGSIEQAHSLNEYVDIDQLDLATRLYLHVTLDLLT